MADDRVEDIMAKLREQGGRVTTPRLAIVDTLLKGHHHMTADAVAAAVHDAHPDIHLSTVYRTLDTLTDLGVINHVHLGHGPAVYHLADEAHHHLVCDRCGTVIELPADVFDALGQRVEREYGFHLDAHHFALGGRCGSCR